MAMATANGDRLAMATATANGDRPATATANGDHPATAPAEPSRDRLATREGARSPRHLRAHLAVAWRGWHHGWMAAFALALRFALELNAIAAVGIWGFRAGGGGVTGAAYAGAAIVVLIGNWAWFIAPKSTRSPLPMRWRTLAGAALMLLTAGLLAIAGEPVVAAGFAVIVVVDTAALFALGAADQDWPVMPGPAGPGAVPMGRRAATGRGSTADRGPAAVRRRGPSSSGSKRRKRR